MDKQALKHLFNKHYRANCRLWRSIMALSDEQFTQSVGDGEPSIQTQVVSMVANENLWVNYLWHGEVEFLNVSHLPTRTCIRAEWGALEEEMRDFIDELSPAELESRVEPEFLNGATSLRVWEILVQITDQAAESRAQLSRHLHDFGSPAPTQDVIAFALEQPHAIPA